MSLFYKFILIGLSVTTLYSHSLIASADNHSGANNSDSFYSWDVDADGEADALTDGLLMLRYNFGLRGDNLTVDAISQNSVMSSAEIEAGISNMSSIADIDANSEVDALTDGLLLLRYLFGLRGELLVSDVIGSNASRSTSTEIMDHLDAHMPGQMPVDSDNDGVPDTDDDFPHDADETTDSDGDGVGDNADDFPNNAGETTDSDGDGIGDIADAFPNDPEETQDLNNNGIGDNADANAAPQSNYCATPVYHFNFDNHPGSGLLTIENTGPNSISVTIVSNDGATIDLLTVFSTGDASPTIITNGVAQTTLTWSQGTMPTSTELSVMWSDNNIPGNVQLNQEHLGSIDTSAVCSGGGSSNGGTGDSGSNTDSTYQDLSLVNGEIKVAASSYSDVVGLVQQEDTTDIGGGQNVGYLDPNDTLIYNLNIPFAGEYTVFYRVASLNGSSPGFQFYLNNVLKHTINVCATNDWQGWTTIEGDTVNLPQGNNEIRLKAPVGALNINWFSFRNDDYSGASDSACETGSGTDTDAGTGNSNGNFEPPSVIIDEVNVSYVESSGGNEQSLLVGGSGSSQPGFALYVFDADTVNGDASNCYGGCAIAWPPLLVTDGVPSGISGLGKITRNDQTEQITYQGRPLYFYNGDSAVGDFNGDNISGWHSVEYQEIGDVHMLYNANTLLEPPTSFELENNIIVTRFGDRGRDRHAKENAFGFNYDHYLSNYWVSRTYRVQFKDYVRTGQSLIEVTWITEAPLDPTAMEFRYWHAGDAGVTGRFIVNPDPSQDDGITGVQYHGSGIWDNNFERISDSGSQHKYTMNITQGADGNNLVRGTNMEFEASLFLAAAIHPIRMAYYGTSFVYYIGEKGVHPFEWDRGTTSGYTQKDGNQIPLKAQSGGMTTLGFNYTNEPAGRFMQMATNMAPENAQPFVRGRRVHHTSFEDGIHGEDHRNVVWSEQANKVGNHYISESCASCHVRNGRALVADVGQDLEKWVFNVGDENGAPMSTIGRVLQPVLNSGVPEGSVKLAAWTEHTDGEFAGLRSPNYQFIGVNPSQFSARIAPQIVGVGLLEAVDESTIMSWVDENDDNDDEISGRASFVEDPETNEIRLGRFGYKAGTFSVKHQVASAFNTDMGIMTSMIPNPDCGSEQTSCGNSGVEIDDQHVDDLVKYLSLLGVGASRYYKDNYEEGETLFESIGCAGCHRPSMVTSNNHPLAELRGQTIYPYTDMLLHDMGEGLADNLAEGSASGSEWRTAPLWGLGFAENVMLGDEKGIDQISTQDFQNRSANEQRIGYLHDGRARTIDEAIRWHGGEAETARIAYDALDESAQNVLLNFLESL